MINKHDQHDYLLKHFGAIVNSTSFFQHYFLRLLFLLGILLQPEIAFCDEMKPRVSIITSVFKGDQFIEGFLENITKQTIFDQCELLLINANSPGNEEVVIRKYLERHQNIRYVKLDHDPGVYGVWNIGIKMAKSDLITNANLDDRRCPDLLLQQVEELESNPSIDLVYSDYLLTRTINDSPEQNNFRLYVTASEFNIKEMNSCVCGPQPVWRKSIHDRCGLFSSRLYSSGDLEMWNRAVSKGCVLKKTPGISGLYYENPNGLSTKPDSKKNLEDRFIYGAYSYLWKQTKEPKLLIKIPTRSRPKQFFDLLDIYYRYLSGDVAYHFLISLDEDDASMNNPSIIETLQAYPNLSYYFGKSSSKVEAVNRDIEKHLDFDYLLIASDDMEPVRWGYDKTIAEFMKCYFPNKDGVLNFSDGFARGECNTYPVLGKKFYEMFGYVYNPEYQSLYCNVELTLVSKILRKEAVVDLDLLVHNHPCWGRGKMDTLYTRNENLKAKDLQIFQSRRGQGFQLKSELIEKATPHMWSILICTLDEREKQFKPLYQKLCRQIKEAGLSDQIEILFYRDNRELKVGQKRNFLLTTSSGKYVSFIDDDDDIHDNYIKMIFDKLCLNPDCVSLAGIMTTQGQNPCKFIHSIQYNNQYCQKDNVYYRPPNHLNPLRRSIAIQFTFPETNLGEDRAWALAIAESGLLKTEEHIDEPYYFYRYDGKYEK